MILSMNVNVKECMRNRVKNGSKNTIVMQSSERAKELDGRAKELNRRAMELNRRAMELNIKTQKLETRAPNCKN